MQANRLPILILVLYLSLSLAWGQTPAIKGKVIDKNTGEGIPFAHVIFENTSSGAITDLYGNFVLSFHHGRPDGNLTVSCVGYKTVRISSTELSLQPILIHLELDIVKLDEVVVTPEDPLELLREAVRRVPVNYDTVTTVLSGYYKVSSMLQNANVHYTEAFIDIFNRAYLEEPERKDRVVDSIRVREARLKPKEVNDWKLEVMLPWERSIYQLEFRDIARDFIGRKELFEKFLNSYDFELENLVIINGRSSYMIKLLPKKNRKLAYWNGYVYLDRETLAIAKWETVSTPRMFSQLKGDLGYIILSKLYGVRYEEGEWKERITYEKRGDKWYLKEVNSSKHFEISSKKRDLDMAPVNVTLQFRTDSVRRMARPDSLDYLPTGWGWQMTEYLNQRYDSSFWDDFDRARGIATDDSTYAIVASGKPDQAYTISRLDSLQGALTPLRTCFDVTFYHLDVEILLREEVLKGSNLIRFRVMQPTDLVQIDLFSEMIIDSITWRGIHLNFEREYNAVYVDFPHPLQRGSTEEIKVYYAGRPVDVDPRIPMYAAFLWAEDQNGTPWLQAICQGYGASGWWPNKDHLSDEPDSMALSYTVPSNLELVANGRLRNKINLSGNKTRYEWLVTYPINNYNATVNVGDYKHIHDVHVSGRDTLALDYYVLPYHLDNATQKLSVVKPMLRTYEKYFGKYPFYRDGFKLVESPHAMEHQSCVAIDAGYFDDPEPPDFSNGNINFSIVLHESAHEWWGNNVSCTDNAELWLHESFATYAEALYIEDHYGPEASQQYLNRMKESVANRNPIIGPVGVNYIHHGDGDMFEKGALMLNTLRHVINNDSIWFATLKGIQEEFRYRTIDTDDIVRYINEKSGADYSCIFDQYLRFPDIPEFEFTFETVDGSSWLNYRWISDIDGFRMPLAYRTGNMGWQRLLPTTEWQRIAVPDNASKTFGVDTDNFYIRILTR